MREISRYQRDVGISVFSPSSAPAQRSFKQCDVYKSRKPGEAGHRQLLKPKPPSVFG